MIGVIADPADHVIVSEFFELFKTPWEFYRQEGQYQVLLCAGQGQLGGAEKLVICYSGRNTDFDAQNKIPVGRQRQSSSFFSYHENRIPIYGNSLTFTGRGAGSFLKIEDSQESLAYLQQSGERAVARIGYDLFGEVRRLLTVGQPVANAKIPTLELHIALLRDLIASSGISLVEIPPVPAGFRFVACLTHDVDHPAIRLHKWDHTVFGFLLRAIFGSLRNLVRGRMSLKGLFKNWAAVLKLPFVHLGLAKDFWRVFDDCYLELEKGLTSTFFVIPFKNHPGKSLDGPAPKFRAASYQAKDIADAIRKLTAAGHEVGLHGIDAWIDNSRGGEEIEEIRRVTGASGCGVRMHWLYYDEQSPKVLEKAGASYDSTIGYNETVGYRAGTTQAFKPLEVGELLELPMHAMDTALFYPSYLDLSLKGARLVLGQMVDNAVQLGGCLTVNWHDRSLAPERQWDACYRDLVREMKSRGAWFSTAGQATSWFRKRRSAVFEMNGMEGDGVRARVVGNHHDSLPCLLLRTHMGRNLNAMDARGSESYFDSAIDESLGNVTPSEARK